MLPTNVSIPPLARFSCWKTNLTKFSARSARAVASFPTGPHMLLAKGTIRSFPERTSLTKPLLRSTLERTACMEYECKMRRRPKTCCKVSKKCSTGGGRKRVTVAWLGGTGQLDTLVRQSCSSSTARHSLKW
ncbi:hypothetical protein M404DRAFT_728034 [Pisolithus tinctorius Marx 270]|uniref:Uncharacterized protein n=1 Tax=Pisolithus tinctorius Marx 270 TaxID=870435 RepID=A0A0C3NKV9_PISTI|nr:hypothetical protein M404DRAFT_728034 [Pisolithus tinctorius Marx 270]